MRLEKVEREVMVLSVQIQQRVLREGQLLVRFLPCGFVHQSFGMMLVVWFLQCQCQKPVVLVCVVVFS